MQCVAFRLKIAEFQLLYDQLLPHCHTNDGTVVNNKNIISADFENASQGHHLQKPLYLGYYTDDFNQTFTKMMQLGLTTKVSHKLTLKV